MTIRPSSALLVATALARNWIHRPVRLFAAIAGGAGGVLLTTAVLMIAIPVVLSTRVAPIAGIPEDVVAVTANAPAGISAELAARIVQASGAEVSSQLLTANTAVRTDSGFAPVVVVGIDQNLPALLNNGFSGGTAPAGGGQAYLSRAWAQQHGIGTGATIQVTTPTGLATWQVAALLDGDVANQGAVIAVPIGVAARAFDRGQSVDIVLLRDSDTAKLHNLVAPLVNGAAEVTAPDRVFAGYNRIYRTPLMLVTLFVVIAVLTGSVVVFLTWRLALAEARPMLSRMRLLGVRTVELMLGSGLLLVPVVLLTYLVGAAAGVLLGRSLTSFRSQLTNFTGQAFEPALNLSLPLIGAFLAATTMFGFAWLTSLRQLRRMTAIDAITGRDKGVIERSRVRWPLLAGLICFLVATGVVAFTSGPARGLAVIPTLLGLVLLSAVLPVVIGTVVRSSTSGVSGLLVGRQLEVEWRRNAALAITFAIALLTSIAMVGIASSIRNDIQASMLRVTKGDLYALAAPVGSNFGSETFPASIRDEISVVPGVASTDMFAFSNVEVNGGRYRVQTTDGDVRRFSWYPLAAGPQDVIDGKRHLAEYLTGDNIAISANFGRTQHLEVGSTVNIPVPNGHRQAAVIAVIDDSTSDGGMIAVGNDLYQQVVGNAGIYAIGIALGPDADRATVQQQVATLLAPRYPRAQMYTAAEYQNGISSNLGRLMSSFTVFGWVMYLVAAVVGTATLASSIAERGRAVALTRLVGGRARVVRRLLAIEALIIVAGAWLVAVPGALLAIPATIGMQSAASGLLPPVRIPAGMVVASLPLALLAAAVALLIARRSFSERPLAELVADE